ncbi:hypothetical protein SLEP1_g10462 [Rubroshorea leprosula]|uniref:Uncharacterized protein n=1 Tax=Rubroshorea leprosula TaxID=152421 RepID=A0AAV5I860_9ROSI|nr:hypothetical protein SLEP1_g10462 [Rubroshorea leprosula]
MLQRSIRTRMLTILQSKWQSGCMESTQLPMQQLNYDFDVKKGDWE